VKAALRDVIGPVGRMTFKPSGCFQAMAWVRVQAIVSNNRLGHAGVTAMSDSSSFVGVVKG
jgi:hypothetical protein